ncbi:hypothetical protein [Halobellus rubicundus]|uniref:CopG family transcriptional regulator n=1 Tax=Halobellus rubicundus TaxID=2996466 RepID=A0ABD5M9J8_9EURY
MSDEFPGGDDSASTSFEAWLDQQAESQGMSREEVFEQLVSSYWTLNEMTQLLDDSGGAGAPIRRRDAAPGSGGRFPDGDGSETGQPSNGSAPRRRDQPDGEHGEADDDSRAEATPTAADLEERIDDLESELEALETGLESEVEHGQTLDQLFDALAERLSEVESELDEVAASAESTETALTGRIEAVEADLTDRQAALEDEHEQVEAWLDAEFDSLRTILEYLLDRTDGLEHEIESTGSRQERELERLREEWDALQSIKQEAAAHDAHAGECAACGEEIDLDLLARPYCPHCDAPLSGVETESRWWLFTDTVVTTANDGRDGGRSATGERSGPLPSGERTREEREPRRGRSDDHGTGAPPTDGPTEPADGLDTPPELDETVGDRASGGPPSTASDDADASTEPGGRSRDRRHSEADSTDKSDADVERPPESIDLETPFGDDGSALGGGSEVDERRADDPADTTDSTASTGSDDGSGFEFGGTADSGDASDGPTSDASERDAEPTQSDSPFGDLEELRREENGDGDT